MIKAIRLAARRPISVFIQLPARVAAVIHPPMQSEQSGLTPTWNSNDVCRLSAMGKSSFMKSIHSLVLGISLLLSASFVQAQTYNLSLGQYPPCSTNWDVSGTTYTCNGDGRVTLPDGAHVIANTTVIIVANNGFSLNNNTVGSADHNINLRAAYGSVNAVGSNIIHGNVTSTGGSTIMLNGTVVAGDVTTNGHINLVGGSVGGKVTSFQNTITTNNTDLNGGAQANSGMNITGG